MKHLIKILLILAFVLLGGAGKAQTAAWPNKPIRLINAFPPGTPPDTFARLYAESLSKSLGVPVVVENKPGAGGNLASDQVAKAPADGYTFLYTVSNAFVINPYIYSKLPFDSKKDLVPVAPILSQGLVLVTNNDFPAKNLKDLVIMARAQPGQLSYASYGAGGYPHLTMELLADAAKIQVIHVPYKQGPLNDVIGGQVPMMIEPVATAAQFIKSGRVRAIAYSGTKRHPALPDVPTISETYPAVTAIGWHGVWAPRGTPSAIVTRLNNEIGRLTRSADFTTRITNLNCEPMTATPGEMAALVARESTLWSGIVRSKNINVD